MKEPTTFNPLDVQLINFVTNKYNRELLIDVAWIHEMPTFRKTIDPYMLTFYDVTLITGGTGSFWLDETQYVLKPNQVLFTTPGQVRRWYAEELEGICLFFPASFFIDHFNDPLLLHRLHYFHTKIGPGDLVLNSHQYEKLQSRLSAMHAEIAELASDSGQILRTQAYEILLLINRWYTNTFGQLQEKSTHKTVSRFRLMLEENFHRYHKVADYAGLLAVTPGHLNVLCKTHLGSSASQLIMNRVFTEAKRQLTHSRLPIEELSINLGFVDPSYFCRAFKREVGKTPLRYRKQRSF